MAIQGTLIYLCSLAVLFTAAQDESTLNNCSSNTQLYEHLSDNLKEAAQCHEALFSQWSSDQIGGLALSLRDLTDTLHTHQLRACHGEPKTCPMPEVPSNGGLACVTVNNTRYCKPMCNHGYDFGFPRMTRLYEDCSDRTWSTMYIGGNKLAVCNKTPFAFVGASTAYFPEAQDCSTTLANSQLKTKILEDFISELSKHGKDGEAQHTCLVCG